MKMPAVGIAALLLFGVPLIVGRAWPCGGGHHDHSGFLRRHLGEPAAPPPREPVVVIREPFFCFAHNLGFGSEVEFFDHLRTVHHVNRGHASAHLLPIGGHVVFFSF
jgi:hypothetical protein